VASAQRGERPPDHPPQSQVPIINEWIHRTNRDRPLAHVLRDLQDVWQELAERLQALPEESPLRPSVDTPVARHWSALFRCVPIQ
jgi:hypothetical protein